MPEGMKAARRRAKDAADDVNGAGEDLQDEAQSAGDTAQDTAGQAAGGSRTITGELKDTFREAAIEVLKPVAKQATTAAAKYAVKRGPDLVKGKLEDAGGAGALAKGVASKGGGVAGAVGGLASGIGGKLGGGGGKKDQEDSPSGTGRGRRLPVQEYIDIGVDIQTAYDQFTQFEDWPKFMHRVENIEQRDDTTLMWHENIWGVRRSWEADIEEQIPCERIMWRSKGGTQTIGVVTFHKLADNLTRIAITMDFQPKGLFEKAASGTRISRRALKSDLMRFKAFVELRDEATGEWRGRIEDGEPVEESDEQRDDERDEEEPQASEEDDYEDEDDEEEPTAEEDEEEPAAEEDDDEPTAEEDDEEPSAEEDDEEPRAEEDEDVEEEDDEEEDDEPSGRGRFARDDEEPEEEGEEEPAQQAVVRPRRRSRRKTTTSEGR